MRLGFRERPYDLFGVVGASALALVVIATTGPGPARSLLGLLLVLFVPGYSIAAAVFPKAGEMDLIERVALSFGISIATVPLLGLLLNGTPSGVSLEPVAVSLLLATLGMCGVAYWRRMQLPPKDRPGLLIDVGMPSWPHLAPVDKVLAIGAVLALIAAAGGIVYSVGVTPQPERYTEFYLLDANGGVSAYPTHLNTTEQAVVIVGVVNHEHQVTTYTVEPRLVTVQYVYNGTTKRYDVFDISSVTYPRIPLSLGDGGRWEHVYPFGIANPGDYQLRFFLYYLGEAEPHDQIQLAITVV